MKLEIGCLYQPTNDKDGIVDDYGDFVELNGPFFILSFKRKDSDGVEYYSILSSVGIVEYYYLPIDYPLEKLT